MHHSTIQFPLARNQPMLESEVTKALTKARNKISSPNSWCQEVSARNSRNEQVPSDSIEACKWCIVGAMYAVIDYRHTLLNPMFILVEKSIKTFRRVHANSFSKWNDDSSRTQQEVVDVLNAAIELSKSMITEINKKTNNDFGYICGFGSHKISVYAPTLYNAKKIAFDYMLENKMIKKSQVFQLWVECVEDNDGNQIVHTPHM